MSNIEIIKGDIIDQDTDVIVNAAKPSLMGGSGVDGAIHSAGGPAIHEECQRIRINFMMNFGNVHGINVGDAVVTGAGNLKARWVIHTAGPVWHSDAPADDLLAQCFVSSLRIADDLGASSISFPAISTGVYGYPLERAAGIALGAVLKEATNIELVRFVLYDEQAYKVFQDMFD